MVATFVDWVLENGRLGAAVMMLLGLALLGYTVVDIMRTEGFFLLMPVAGFCFVVLGAVLFVFRPGHARRKPAPAAPLDADLVRALKKRERPYHLCTACRKVTPFSPCMHCDRAVDVVEIRYDEDLRLALVAME